MTRIYRQSAIGVALLLALIAYPVWGQQIGELQAGGTSYYKFARPGQNTVQVLVLGGARSGIYEVGEDIDLAELLALSGGPGGRGPSKTTVQLYRTNDGTRDLVFEAEMEGFMERTEYPALQPGDTVRIETIQRRPFDWRDALRIITAVSSITFTIHRLLD